MKKEYRNGSTTVIWKPELCYHSKNCVRNLPDVFDPNEKPWIRAERATERELRATIDKCPSGALSYKVDGETEETDQSAVIEVMTNGPVLVKGSLRLKRGEREESLDQKVIALCRCGSSKNKPYCDGTHSKIGFVAD